MLRSTSKAPSSGDRGLSTVVSVALLVAVTGLLAAGLHLWVGTFTAPDADLDLRTCDARNDTVSMALDSEDPLPFVDLTAALHNETGSRDEARFVGIPLDGDWEKDVTLHFGNETAQTGVPWPQGNTLGSNGGLDGKALYSFRLGYIHSGKKIATSTFHCR